MQTTIGKTVLEPLNGDIAANVEAEVAATVLVWK
jgi:hypothetical protein